MVTVLEDELTTRTPFLSLDDEALVIDSAHDYRALRFPDREVERAARMSGEPEVDDGVEEAFRSADDDEEQRVGAPSTRRRLTKAERELANVRATIERLPLHRVDPGGAVVLLTDDGVQIASGSAAFRSHVVAAAGHSVAARLIADALTLDRRELPRVAPPARTEVADRRPEIRLSSEAHENVDASIDALSQHPHVYQRDGRLVHVVRASADDQQKSGAVGADGKTQFRIVEGTPLVRHVALSTLAEMLTMIGRYTKYDARSDTWKPTRPDKLVVEATANRGQYIGLRELVGVCDTPSIRPDGSLLDRPGYDAATGFLYAPTIDFPPVPERPTQLEAAKALAELCEVFGEMPWQDEPSRYVPICALLALVARPGIRGSVPCIIFNAAAPGTGKTYAADAVCIIGTGRPSPRGTFPYSDVELEKVLAGHAAQSARVVGFDNIPIDAEFGGAPLDKVLTAVRDVEFRVLGQTNQVTMRWNAVVIAGGNNVSLKGDTPRRALIARMVSPLERPEERVGFKHHPFLPWVDANRGRLVAAALTVLRAKVVAGAAPTDVTTTDSFSDFARVVASAITYAGGPNVLLARPAPGAADGGERGAMAVVLAHWPRLQGADGITLRNALSLLYPERRANEGSREPDGFDPLREALETLSTPQPGRAPDVKRIGNKLRTYIDRTIGGSRLTIPSDDRNGIARWRVVEVGS